MSAPDKIKYPEKYAAYCIKQSENKTGKKPWNTGLTKADPRVLQTLIKRDTPEWRGNISKGNTGKVRTPEQNLRNSQSKLKSPGGRGQYYKDIGTSIIEELGGHCQICGMSNMESNQRWNRNLDTHHHLGVKNFQVTDGIQRPLKIGIEKSKEEARELTTPLCCRCHPREEWKERKSLKF